MGSLIFLKIINAFSSNKIAPGPSGSSISKGTISKSFIGPSGRNAIGSENGFNMVTIKDFCVDSLVIYK